MEEEYKIKNHGKNIWTVTRRLINEGNCIQERVVRVTDPGFLLADLPYIFEGSSELSRLREAGLI